MTLIESQGPHFSEDLSSWGPQVNLGQINLPECEGRISGEFAELMTASCRAAVPSVEDLACPGRGHGQRGRRYSIRKGCCAQNVAKARSASQPLTEQALWFSEPLYALGAYPLYEDSILFAFT